MYSYFEKGRTKCTRQSRKILREILSSLFCKEIWKNGTSDRGRMFASAKGKKQSRFDSYSPGTVCCLYPIIPFRIVAYRLFPTTFLEIAVYLCRPDPTRTQNDHIWKRQCHKFYSIRLSPDVAPSPLDQFDFPTFKWLNEMWICDDGEKVWTHFKSVFQRRFHWRCRCRIVG